MSGANASPTGRGHQVITAHDFAILDCARSKTAPTAVMPDERAAWIRQSSILVLLTAGFHLLQFVASGALWFRSGSPVLAAFGLDSIVSAVAAMMLAFRIHRSYDTLTTAWRSRAVAYGYIIGAVLALLLGIFSFLDEH